jgi:hypothetical protein
MSGLFREVVSDAQRVQAGVLECGERMRRGLDDSADAGYDRGVRAATVLPGENDRLSGHPAGKLHAFQAERLPASLVES